MKLIVNPHKIEIDKSPVNEKEIKVTEIEFEFSEEIPVNYVKDVYFTLGSNTYQVTNIQNNKCDIPYEVLESKGQVEIGVVAYLLDNDEYVKRYNPSPVYFSTWEGSLKDEYDNTEEITPTDKEQLEQELNDGLVEIREAVETITTAVEGANNLDLDVFKEGKVATVTLTKKDASTKVVTLSDGTNLMFNWSGTSLGIKTDEDEEYTYVDLQGVQGEQGPMGAPFTIKKTYSSVAEMNADFNNMNVGDYVMIASTVETEDNAKLYTRGEEQWIFITDFSGATGIQGPTGATPNIQIGTVTSGQSPSVTRTGTNENPVLNFVLQKGDTGATGETGATGATGNGIASIIKTGTSGLVDTYTITYTNGNTTTFTVTNGEDGEVTQAQLDRAMMVYNALPKVEDEDTEITLDGTANCPMELELNPSALTQETTTGANIQKYKVRTNPTFNYVCDDKGQVTITGNITGTANNLAYNYSSENPMNLTAGTYTLKVVGTMSSLTGLNRNGINLTLNSNQECTFTLDNDVNGFIIQFNIASGTHNDNFYVTLASGTTATTERYTGGIPQPNPEFPSDVQVIKGNNSIRIGNKNLQKFSSRTSSGTYNYNCDNKGQVTITGTVSSSTGLSYNLSSNYVLLTAGTYKMKVIGNAAGVTFTSNNGYAPIGSLDSNQEATVTVSQDISNFQIFQYLNTGITYNCNYYITLTSGTTATTERYKEQVLPLNLPSGMEYCKIGNYEDEFEHDGNKWYINKVIGEVVLDGTGSADAYTVDPFQTGLQYYSFNIDLSKLGYTKAVNSSVCYCDKLSYSTSSIYSNDIQGIKPTSAGLLKIKIFDGSLTTVQQFKDWLSNNNLTVYYQLTAPTHTEITDSTLISQLNAIEQAVSYDEQTNISQTNAQLPFRIKASAVMSLTNIFNLIGE